MAHDERRDETGPDLPDPSSSDLSGCPSAAECRRFDREQLKHCHRMAWFERIRAETTLWQILATRDQAKEAGDAAWLAEFDQRVASLKDEWRCARHEMRRLRA